MASAVRAATLPSTSSTWTAIERDMAHDRQWSAALRGLPDKLLRFALSAATDSLPTNRNLALWRRLPDTPCPLCKQVQTLGHLLNGCPCALQQGRYTFRHDLVLGCLGRIVQVVLPELVVNYVLDYVQPHRPVPSPLPIPTTLRPDLVLYDGHTYWLLELTVPLSHRLPTAHTLKLEKYSDLVAKLRAAGHPTQLLPWEVSSLGIVGKSTAQALALLGFPAAAIRATCKVLARAALDASFSIYRHRNQPAMPPQPLLSLVRSVPLPPALRRPFPRPSCPRFVRRGLLVTDPPPSPNPLPGGTHDLPPASSHQYHHQHGFPRKIRPAPTPRPSREPRPQSVSRTPPPPLRKEKEPGIAPPPPPSKQGPPSPSYPGQQGLPSARPLDPSPDKALLTDPTAQGRHAPTTNEAPPTPKYPPPG